MKNSVDFKAARQYFEQSNDYEASRNAHMAEQQEKTKKPRDWSRVRLIGLTALALAGSVAVFEGKLGLTDGRDPARAQTEACVGKLVNREITIPRDALGQLQRPASIFDEQTACERWDNNPALAKAHLRHIPLGQ